MYEPVSQRPAQTSRQTACTCAGRLTSLVIHYINKIPQFELGGRELSKRRCIWDTQRRRFPPRDCGGAQTFEFVSFIGQLVELTKHNDKSSPLTYRLSTPRCPGELSLHLPSIVASAGLAEERVCLCESRSSLSALFLPQPDSSRYPGSGVTTTELFVSCAASSCKLIHPGHTA